MKPVGAYLIYESFATHSQRWEKGIVIARTVVGGLFVVGCLLKLASLWDLIRIDWLEGMVAGTFEAYLAVCIILFVGIALIYSGLKPKAIA